MANKKLFTMLEKSLITFSDNIYKKAINSFHNYGFNKNLISKGVENYGTSNDNIVGTFITSNISELCGPRKKNIKNFDKKIFRKIFKK